MAVPSTRMPFKVRPGSGIKGPPAKKQADLAGFGVGFGDLGSDRKRRLKSVKDRE